MYHKRFYGKLALGIIVLAAILSFHVPAFSQPEIPDLIMEVSAGFDGTARLAPAVPFRISLTNRGEELSGSIEIYSSVDTRNTEIYAAPFTLPRGSQKSINVNVPVRTANKKIKIKVVSEGKVVKEGVFEFNKLLSPQTPFIGILSDDFEALRYLNGIKLSENLYLRGSWDLLSMEKYAYFSVTGETVESAERPVELIRFSSDSFPADEEVLNSIDVLIINNFNTASLSDNQIKAIKGWLGNGGILVLGTGPSSSKVMGGLGEILDNPVASDPVTLTFPETFKEYTGRDIPSANINVAGLNPGNASILAGSGQLPLAAVYTVNEGSLIVLSFDPGLEPFNSWSGAQDFWKKLIHDFVNIHRPQESNPFTLAQYNLEYLAGRVPDDQTPPFGLMLVIVGAYILIAGPVIYIILKHRDRRDSAWVLIPTLSIMFMGIIYLAGFKTRYTTAVVNNFSLVNIDQDKDYARIDTNMGVFNNRSGKLQITYTPDSGIKRSTGIYYDGRTFYPQNEEYRDERVLSRTLLSDPVEKEVFDVGLWNAKYLYGSKTFPLSGDIIESFSINGMDLEVNIRNTASFPLLDAFLVMGNNYIEVGDIFPGDKKHVAVSLSVTNSEVKKSLGEYLEHVYGPPGYRAGQKTTDDMREKMRKRNIIQSVFNGYHDMGGNLGLSLYALSSFNLDYGLIVNGKEPKVYNTAVIHAFSSINAAKGSEIDIPPGMIIPHLEGNRIAYYEDIRTGIVRVEEKGDIEFSFSIPKGISCKSIMINWPDATDPIYKPSPDAKVIPLPEGGESEDEGSIIKYFIQNISTSEWEATDKVFLLDENLSSYINTENVIKLKAAVKPDWERGYGNIITAPELQLTGVIE